MALGMAVFFIVVVAIAVLIVTQFALTVAKDEIIAAVRGYSEIEQRKLDEIVGKLELLETASHGIVYAIAHPETARLQKPEKRKGPPVIQDFEASQKATLEEYRES